MEKVIRVGTLKLRGGGTYHSLFCKIEFKNGRLSISGVIGPRTSGNAAGECGQIDMEFAHRNPADDDTRYTKPIKPDAIRFTTGWDAEKWFDFLDVWKRYHLNDMHAECEHQRELGWSYKTHPMAECPTCGYKLGSAWKSENVPQHVIDFLAELPDADRQPAWV